MRSTRVLTRDAVMAAVDRYRAALNELVTFPLDGLDVRDLFAVVDAMQTGRCQTPVVEHEALRLIGLQVTPEQIGKSLPKYLADRLRIRPGEARRRVADTEMLDRRTALSGEPLQPVWPATAAAQRAGHINAAHVAEIRRFFTQLPGWVDAPTRACAEADLAEQATSCAPTSYASSQSGWPTASTRMGTSPMRIGLAGAASPSDARTSMACRRSVAG